MITRLTREEDMIDPRDKAPEALHSLTLSPRGVLVARVPEYTPLDHMQGIQNYLKECFPNNKVVVIWDTVSLSVVEDESYHGRMSPEHDTSNYY